MKKSFLSKHFVKILVPLLLVISACASQSQLNNSYNYSGFNPDTVKARRFDTGKMWTFENAPVKYFEKTYHFSPTQGWLDSTRMSALKFANWCSASFVSADGLIMTNHHCVDFITKRIQKKGENIKKTGFYAKTLSDERRVPNLYVDQLVYIRDVTSQVDSAIVKGKTGKENFLLKSKKIKKLEDEYSKATGLICKIVPLYDGAKYSLYGYRRYKDVRLVFIAESEVGLYGGDPDNFTYPRYNPDYSFLRVYEDGKPLKTDYYFKWSSNGAKPGAPLFVVGNPGKTERLKTVAQLEYLRDVSYRNRAYLYEGLRNIFKKIIKKYPDKSQRFKNFYFMLANAAKSMTGELKGLRDPYLMARKAAFEKKFKEAIFADPKLAAKYGHVWKALSELQNEKREYAYKAAVYELNPFLTPVYFNIANKMVDLAKNLKLPEEKRKSEYKAGKLKETVAKFFPENFFLPYEKMNLRLFAGYLALNLGVKNPIYQKLFGGKTGNAAVEYALNHSQINTKNKAIALAQKGADAILNSSDPFIYFVLHTKNKREKLAKRMNELNETEKVLENNLGQALYAVYGTSIPPDATFTLRISDGVMKGYHYNGTIAPMFTTFYGIYNRYYSHQKKFPWALPKEWLNNIEDLKLSTPLDFVSTADITGGNSGSPVINEKRQIVGVAFDGNIESLPGEFLYSTKSNRMVAVASQGIIAALGSIYKAKRLVEELKLGRIPDKYKK